MFLLCQVPTVVWQSSSEAAPCDIPMSCHFPLPVTHPNIPTSQQAPTQACFPPKYLQHLPLHAPVTHMVLYPLKFSHPASHSSLPPLPAFRKPYCLFPYTYQALLHAQYTHFPVYTCCPASPNQPPCTLFITSSNTSLSPPHPAHTTVTTAFSFYINLFPFLP